MRKTMIFLVALLAVISVYITGGRAILAGQSFNVGFAGVLFASLLGVGALMVAASIALEYLFSKMKGGGVVAFFAISSGLIACVAMRDWLSEILSN